MEKNLDGNPSSESVKELEWEFLIPFFSEGEFLDWDFWILEASGSVERIVLLWYTDILYSTGTRNFFIYCLVTAKTIFQLEGRLLFRHLIYISGSSL